MSAELVQDWYFTFGHGQRGIAVGLRRCDPEPQGFPLAYRYVRIHGTYQDARAEMVRMFGCVWSGQYSSAQSAGVDEYGLVELVVRTRHDESDGAS